MSLSKARSYTQFISVLTPPTSSGELVFSFTTVDAVSNISATVTVTPVVTGTSEIDLANQIYDAFVDQLSAYPYAGAPVFNDLQPQATFRMSVTEHIASAWSQASFTNSFKLVTNTTGALIKLDNNKPDFLTIADAKDFAFVRGFTFAGGDGTPFTDAQIGNVLSYYCAEIVAKLGSFQVLATYLNQFRGKDNKSVFLKPTPIVYVDTVTVKQKAFNVLFGFPGYSATMFNVISSTGELNFIPDSTLVNTRPPFRMDNEVQVTFIAGYPTIPLELKQAIILLYLYDSQGLAGLKSLAGDSFKLEIASSKEILIRILAPLKPYKS